MPDPYSWCLVLILVFCLMFLGSIETTAHWLYQLKRVKSRMPVHLKLSSALTQRISKGCLPFPCIRTVALNFYIVINATIIIYEWRSVSTFLEVLVVFAGWSSTSSDSCSVNKFSVCVCQTSICSASADRHPRAPSTLSSLSSQWTVIAGDCSVLVFSTAQSEWW